MLILNNFRLEEGGVVTDCRMRTLHFDPILDYDICTENVIGRCFVVMYYYVLLSVILLFFFHVTFILKESS